MSIIPSFFGGRRTNVFDPVSLDIWDPFEGFPFGRSTLATFRPSLPPETAAFVNPKIDWKETPETHIFIADIPGVKKDEVRVEVEEGNIVKISGERTTEIQEKTDKWHRVETSSGKFLRRFRLPENVKVDQVKANMENGVLTIVVPKEEVKQPEVKSIDVSG
ncbi:18.2 kDa class I heat shock protein-like [Tasmannia lanceolata]|uniref:18.2 kDa class I heat shock protein-like n=1 Tax=Tasmannia lanceolata TaxID=3420 RepID=UPI004063EE95